MIGDQKLKYVRSLACVCIFVHAHVGGLPVLGVNFTTWKPKPLAGDRPMSVAAAKKTPPVGGFPNFCGTAKKTPPVGGLPKFSSAAKKTPPVGGLPKATGRRPPHVGGNVGVWGTKSQNARAFLCMPHVGDLVV